MKKGKIAKKVKGTWVIRYDEKVVKNCFGCKPFTTFNELPIDNQILNYEEGSTTYFTERELDGGKFAVIETPPFVSDDFQIGPDGAYEHEDPLDFLTRQAQELDLGYIDGWDNVFKEIEDSLNSPLPIRVKNWLRNKYYSPIIKSNCDGK